MRQVRLLRHFAAHLAEPAAARRVVDAAAAAQPLPFVKKWLQTKQAAVFRLSNRAFQVAFNDGSEVLLSSDTRTLAYTPRGGVARRYGARRRPCPPRLLSRRRRVGGAVARAELGALPPEEDLLRRLRYTRELLAQIVHGGAAPAS